MEIDLLLLLLRDVVVQRAAAAAAFAAASRHNSSTSHGVPPPPLRVVLMSATANAQLFADYMERYLCDALKAANPGELLAVFEGLSICHTAIHLNQLSEYL